MDRIYKFRAWHRGLENSHWKSINHPHMLYDERPGDCLRWQGDGQNIERIMQYIWLDDSQGKEIYECDFITTSTHRQWIFEVIWMPRFCCFTGLNIYDDSHDIILPDHEIVVIGNRYEHPEILKER